MFHLLQLSLFSCTRISAYCLGIPTQELLCYVSFMYRLLQKFPTKPRYAIKLTSMLRQNANLCGHMAAAK